MGEDIATVEEILGDPDEAGKFLLSVPASVFPAGTVKAGDTLQVASTEIAGVFHLVVFSLPAPPVAP